jgi:hypothetical protein
MDVQSVQVKIVNALKNLAPQLHSTAHYMPAGDGGIFLFHLIDSYMLKNSIPHDDCSDNTVQISSKTGQVDEKKIFRVLNKERKKGSYLYIPDQRTISGSTFDIAKSYVDIFNKKNRKLYFSDLPVETVALFDPNMKAHIRGSTEDLSDEERGLAKWFNGPSEDPIKYVNGIWKYQTSRAEIGKLPYMKAIKKLF